MNGRIQSRGVLRNLIIGVHEASTQKYDHIIKLNEKCNSSSRINFFSPMFYFELFKCSKYIFSVYLICCIKDILRSDIFW